LLSSDNESEGTESAVESHCIAEPEEPDSCRDLGLYQNVYLEFAEVLSHYLPENDLEELIDLAQYIVDKSHENSLNPYLVLAVIRVESTFNPCALSRKGARGLMQVIPVHILGREAVKNEYAFSYHRFYDPYENIGIGVDYLGSLVSRFGSVESGIVAYNMGPTRLSRRLRQTKTSVSTRYSRKVINQYQKFQSRSYGSFTL
jgi:soluble lytic murein transglycosylase